MPKIMSPKTMPPRVMLALAAAGFATTLIPAGADAASYHHPRHIYPHAAYTYAPQAPWGWRAANPNAGPNSLFTYYRSQGRCVIDEGYGRATLCD